MNSEYQYPIQTLIIQGRKTFLDSKGKRFGMSLGGIRGINTHLTRYHKLRETFSKFYRRYYDLISKFHVGLKSLLRQRLSEPEFYGDLVYKLKKIVGSYIFFQHS